MLDSVKLSGGNIIAPWNWRNFPDLQNSGADLRLGGAHIGPPAVASNPWAIGLNAMVFAGQLASSASSVWDLSQYNVNGFTIEFRIARSALQQGVQQCIMGRWGNGNSNTGFPQQWNIQWLSNNKLEIQFLDVGGTSRTFTSLAAVTNTTAHAIALVFTGTGGTSKVNFFIDGAQQITATTETGIHTATGTPFVLGNWDNANNPCFATIGEVILSNTARYTGTSYVVRTGTYTSDSHTVAYIPMEAPHGTYLGAPVYLGNMATYASLTAANGGFGNPDGFAPVLNSDVYGDWYSTVSAYSTTTTTWKVYALKATSPTSLLTGGGTFAANPIQVPGSSPNEGDIAGNGSVVAWNNKLYHLYDDANGNMKVSSGTTLNPGSPYAEGTTIFAAGTLGFTGFFDGVSRVSLNGLNLEWFFGAQISGGDRSLLYTTCPLGANPAVAANWSAPVTALSHLTQGPLPNSYSEFSYARWPAGTAVMCAGDGALINNGPRIIGAFWSPDGSTIIPSGGLLDAVGLQGSSKYISCFDSYVFWDLYATLGNGPALYLMFSNGTNATSTQPTNADWGVAYFPIVGDGWPPYTAPTLHTFTSGGTYTPPANGFATMYVIAGGGAGGAASGTEAGGGGGAGEILYSASVPVTFGTNYTVTVGAGGTTGAGSNSSVIGGTVSLTSTGGGAGGTGGGNGGAGGSGGGGGGTTTGSTTGGIGTGTATFGMNGGTGDSSLAGGGGGGAYVVGSNASGTAGGAGGAGSLYVFGGAYSQLGGGGGGGSGGGAGGAGGAGGGGAGGASATIGTAGTANTGGGGGGTGTAGSGQAAGGSGLVLILGP